MCVSWTFVDLHHKGVQTNYMYESVYSEDNHCRDCTQIYCYATLLEILHISHHDKNPWYHHDVGLYLWSIGLYLYC